MTKEAPKTTTTNDDDFLDSVCGSLLNDLLSDLNAVDHTQFNNEEEDENLFALIKQELSSNHSALPSIQRHSPAALVVSQQESLMSEFDAGSTEFGNMSLAADFLAADSATKQSQDESNHLPRSNLLFNDLLGEEEDYSLEEEVLFQTEMRAGNKKLPTDHEHNKKSVPVPLDESPVDTCFPNYSKSTKPLSRVNVNYPPKKKVEVFPALPNPCNITGNQSILTTPITATKLMGFQDLIFVIHLMLRPLKSLDPYNDDYYHWSVLNRKSPLSMKGTVAGYSSQPLPVWKGIKVLAKENEETFHQTVKARARDFADKKKSLGQLVKTDVKRPKALLNTTVLNKDHAKDIHDSNALTKSSLGQQSSRIGLWKARVSIDRGYNAFLSLVELRRLIQVHVGAPKLINAHMVDVKTNVDYLHSSLGVVIQVDLKGSKIIEIDDLKLASALSLPKGRVLCARVIEEGILPYPSACHILPVAVSYILSQPVPFEGEARLVHALTGLVLTEIPSIEPSILLRCLNLLITISKTALTSSHIRMSLLHAILSRGKNVCANSPFDQDWSKAEQGFVKMFQCSAK